MVNDLIKCKWQRRDYLLNAALFGDKVESIAYNIRKGVNCNVDFVVVKNIVPVDAQRNVEEIVVVSL